MTKTQILIFPHLAPFSEPWSQSISGHTSGETCRWKIENGIDSMNST